MFDRIAIDHDTEMAVSLSPSTRCATVCAIHFGVHLLTEMH